MNSHITDKFRKAFADMPVDVQKQARQAYRLFIGNPHHPSLRFKPIHPTRPIYSVRDRENGYGGKQEALAMLKELTSE
jgi:hypothetical protein